FKLLADRAIPAEGEPFKLTAEGSTEKISITLADDLLPREVQIATATGVGAASISYSDYFKIENIFYPKTMHIKPDGWHHGIEVHFDKAALKPKLPEADFKPRKKPLVDFGN